jgi:flagellar basal-body rod protein FlgC
MGYFSSLNISASALTAERLRMDIISQNLANINTTRAEDGKPYRRKVVVFEEKQGTRAFSDYLNQSMTARNTGSGVRVAGIVEDTSPYKRVFDPGHPDADETGFVSLPNVETITEMINMIAASRAYEANVTAMNTTKAMALKALDIK